MNRRPESPQSAPAFTAETFFQEPEVLLDGEATDRTDERATAPSVTKSFQCRVAYSDDWARVTAQGGLDVSTVPEPRRMVLAAAVLPTPGSRSTFPAWIYSIDTL